MIVTEDEIAEILALLDDSLTAFAAEAGLPVG
jgi:hypothetical protein